MTRLLTFSSRELVVLPNRWGVRAPLPMLLGKFKTHKRNAKMLCNYKPRNKVCVEFRKKVGCNPHLVLLTENVLVGSEEMSSWCRRSPAQSAAVVRTHYEVTDSSVEQWFRG